MGAFELHNTRVLLSYLDGRQVYAAVVGPIT